MMIKNIGDLQCSFTITAGRSVNLSIEAPMLRAQINASLLDIENLGEWLVECVKDYQEEQAWKKELPSKFPN